MESFTFSLTKAQKLLVKLKKYVDQLKNKEPEYFYSVGESVIAKYESVDNILAKLSTDRENLRDTFKNNLTVTRDFFKLKTLVQTENALVGINVILSDIEYLQQLQKKYESYKHEFGGNVRVVNRADIEYILQECQKEERSYSHTTINTSVFDKAEIESELKTISRQLDKLESKRDQLNATTNITIELSNTVSEYLGLIGH